MKRSLTRTIREDTSLASIGSEEKLWIANAIISTIIKDTEIAPPTVKILSTKRRTEERLILEKISSQEWKYHGSIELTEDLTFIIQSDEGENYGSICFGTTDIQHIRRRFQLDNRVNEVSYEVNGLKLSLTFGINTVLLDEKRSHSGSDNDVGDENLRNSTNLTLEISHGQKSVPVTPEGHEDLPRDINLNSNLKSRFKLKGAPDIASLSEAISLGKEAFQLTKVELIDLGDVYLQRFQRTGNATDLYEAISCQEKAVHLILEGDLDMPIQLGTLGRLYASRFECTGNLAHLSEAILSIQKCIQLTSEGDIKMVKWLDKLGGFYCFRFDKTGNIGDLSEAILLREKAFHLSPDGHPGIPVMLYNLGCSYDSLFQRTRQRTDLDKAASNYSMAVTHSSGIPSFKLLAYKQLARISQELYPSQSIGAYSNAIQLVSQLAGLHATIGNRLDNLRHISYVSTTAAACAFNLGRTDLALEWLEQSRCIVWGQLNDLRTPIGVLRAKDPELADEVVRVSSALQDSGSQSLKDDAFDDGLAADNLTTEEVVKLAREWDELLEKVRTLPDFEDFLQPLSSSTIFDHLPKSGVIILINVHKDRCDALSLVPGDNRPIHTPLPDFSYEKAAILRSRLQAILSVSGMRMREVEPLAITRGMRSAVSSGLTFKNILSQLWLLVVKPILEALGYSEPPLEPKRIWWCLTGPLAFLPIHAAGIYGEPDARFGSILSDFAISSYSPTVRALFDRMRTPLIRDNKKSGLLLISQPDTPGLLPIPKTSDEVQVIQRLIKERSSRVRCLEGAAATIDQTASELGAYSSVHFACHASQDTTQPLKSGFALHDGRLELSSIIQKELAGADFAFLSACQTSKGDETLSEEAVHLAAGMLAAGYRSVVATMWSIRDSYAPEFAKDFYTNVMEGSDGFSGENAALALHHASQNLQRKLTTRKLDPELSFLSWVPYVHFGL